MGQFSIKVVTTQKEIFENLKIRIEVFVNEQQINYMDEFDGLDELATLFIAYDGDGNAVAASRVRLIENSYAKFERVAVLKEFRGCGVGKELIEAMELYVKDNTTIDTIKLSSQAHALEFYKKLGYIAYGEMYLDCEIEHFDMKKSIN